MLTLFFLTFGNDHSPKFQHRYNCTDAKWIMCCTTSPIKRKILFFASQLQHDIIFVLIGTLYVEITVGLYDLKLTPPCGLPKATNLALHFGLLHAYKRFHCRSIYYINYMDGTVLSTHTFSCLSTNVISNIIPEIINSN